MISAQIAQSVFTTTAYFLHTFNPEGRPVDSIRVVEDFFEVNEEEKVVRCRVVLYSTTCGYSQSLATQLTHPRY